MRQKHPYQIHKHKCHIGISVQSLENMENFYFVL